MLDRALALDELPHLLSVVATPRSATRFIEELTEHSRSLGRNDTRSAAGWSAAHWQELARQYLSVALQRGNVWLLTANARRRARDRQHRDPDPTAWYDEPDHTDNAVASTLTTPIGVTKRPPVGPTLQHPLTVVADT